MTDEFERLCTSIVELGAPLGEARQTLLEWAGRAEDGDYGDRMGRVNRFLQVTFPEAVAAEKVKPKEPAGETENAAPQFQVSTLSDFLARTIPPRESLLGFLSTNTLVQIVAFRGTGKTFVGLGCAVAIASGGRFLSWKADKPRRVLVVDGELPEEDLQDRLRLAVATVSDQQVDPGPNLTVLSAAANRKAPNIAEEAGRLAIEEHLVGVEVLVLDAITTLCRGGEENRAESWQPIQDWLVSLRARGITVILLHHTGKDKTTQRGTSKRDDVLDFVILLKHPSDYMASEGCRFELTFEKARHFRDAASLAPFEARLVTDPAGQPVWTMKALAEARDERIRTLSVEGLPAREIAKKLGVSKSTVCRVLKFPKRDEP